MSALGAVARSQHGLALARHGMVWLTCGDFRSLLARAPRPRGRPTYPVAVGVVAPWTCSPCWSELLCWRVLIIDAERRTACNWPTRAAGELAVSSETQPEG